MVVIARWFLNTTSVCTDNTKTGAADFDALGWTNNRTEYQYDLAGFIRGRVFAFLAFTWVDLVLRGNVS